MAKPGIHPDASAPDRPPGSGEDLLLEDFRPLAESLPWQLGQTLYAHAGTGAFQIGGVPYLINSNGILSSKAACLFYESLAEREAQGQRLEPLIVLEAGIGSGLFARGFLRAFERLCEENGRDYHCRLTFIASDSSLQMLQDVRRNDVLGGFKSRVKFALADAMKLNFEWLEDPPERSGPFDAVFLNYLLDSLPAAAVRMRCGIVEQVYVQTTLRTRELSEYTAATAAEIAASAGGDRVLLLDLHHLLDLRCEFRPLGPEPLPHWKAAAGMLGEGKGFMHNYGAIECLRTLAPQLAPEGFILISDYTPAARAQNDPAALLQRFGAGCAMPLSMTELAAQVQGTCCTWTAPACDHSRLIVRMLANGTGPQDFFRESFSKAAIDSWMEPYEAAALWRRGEHGAAFRSYRRAIERCPDNWLALAEAAHFCGAVLHSHALAKEMAASALQMNPVNPEIWNTLGEALYALDEIDEAHRAFERALEFEPRNIRARYNLVSTLTCRRNFQQALGVLGEALADDSGAYRKLLLERQEEILAYLDRRRSGLRSDPEQRGFQAGAP